MTKFYDPEKFEDNKNANAKLFTDVFDAIEKSIEENKAKITNLDSIKVNKVTADANYAAKNEFNTLKIDVLKLNNITSPVEVIYYNGNGGEFSGNISETYFLEDYNSYVIKRYHSSTSNNMSNSDITYNDKIGYREFDGIIKITNTSASKSSITPTIYIPKYTEILEFNILRTGAFAEASDLNINTKRISNFSTVVVPTKLEGNTLVLPKLQDIAANRIIAYKISLKYISKEVDDVVQKPSPTPIPVEPEQNQ